MATIREFLFGTKPQPPAPKKKARITPPTHSRRVRLTVDDPEAHTGPSLFGALKAAGRTDSHREWRTRELDDQTLERIDTPELIDLLIDISPEINTALFHFIRFCNPGYEIIAYRPNTRSVHRKGMAILQELFATLDKNHGAANVVFDQLFLSAYIGGAFSAELVLDGGGTAVDLIPVDPSTFDFESREDSIRGRVWVLGQYQDDDFVPLDVPTVAYVPVDPYPKEAPYGRPLITSTIFSSLFLIGLLHDLRRVVAQQGYPRIDVIVNLERLVNSMPDDQREDPAEVKRWVDAVIDEIEDSYAALQPEDAYVHTDVVEVRPAVGAVDSFNLGFIDNLIELLERMIVRGLKTMPLIMGIDTSTTETHANRQWEIHAAGIKSIQHLAETMLSRLFKTALEARGIICDVKVTFAELRASEKLRDAQTETLTIDNTIKMYDQGWIDQDEAAQRAVGHEPAEEGPRATNNAENPLNVDLAAHPMGDADPEPGASEDMPDESPTPMDLDDQRIVWRAPGYETAGALMESIRSRAGRQRV